MIQLRHFSIWKSRTGKYLLPTLEGLCCLACGGLLCAGLLLLGSIPALVMRWIANILWAVSSFCAGRRAGLHGRTHGIRTGLICSLLLCVILCAGCVMLGETLTERLLIRGILMCPAGIAGGIIGVNTKLRRPPY